ncbi:unnamed protein product [Strongylus vulgaris]|uniref:Uncharacterized protein n=1 Tax=Strongylus vulgaris TaxID=40348 RepID=A0A3P7IU61_STRVU|nr:unnamed protein product [Strongylus vulgaris]
MGIYVQGSSTRAPLPSAANIRCASQSPTSGLRYSCFSCCLRSTYCLLCFCISICTTVHPKSTAV